MVSKNANKDLITVSNEVMFTGQSGATWRYRTDQCLGNPGGFGSVYAAEGAVDGTPMAVKVVKKQRPDGRLDDRLLRREIDIGRKVRESGSDRLLPVIDAADSFDALLLVMARAGAPLSNAMPLEEPSVIAVLTDITAGLKDLHSIGIIHRDLKPPNVLYHHGHWKLADFGIARDQDIGTQDPTFKRYGSAPYMAPELWELKSPTFKTDLYALGCLAFELLTGTPPYTGDQEALRKAHITQAPPEAPCSNITLKNLIGRLMAKYPGDRPQDARAVLDRLNKAVLLRNTVQESIARGLGAHSAEKSRAAAATAAAEATAEERHQEITQAKADLYEILSDALEGLRAVEPEIRLLTGRSRHPTGLHLSRPDPTRPGSPGLEPAGLSRDRRPRFALATKDVQLWIDIWDGTTTGKPVPDDTMIIAAGVCICNRRCSGGLCSANLVYEQLGDRLGWQVYRFRNGPVPSSQYVFGPYARTHGLWQKNFFDPRIRYIMIHGGIAPWSKTVTPLTPSTVLELFQEAVDLRPPNRLAGPH